MKVLICGSRRWDNEAVIRDRLQQLPFETHIIHGGCRGADTIAGEVARRLGFKVTVVKAKWGQYGKVGVGDPAGPIRNREMMDMEPDLVIAFHSDLSKSRGTTDMVKRARRRGIPVEVVGED